ncbi:DUF368 domain-containing protein [Balneatrix alpica]|uniref:DUF368 domain-containing protein n=1 Tax=Balneatrix alpica TaxID=75684 RepID=A0ABV5ZCJ2_9GAMM|nr:DUF368 domain-containing protein [Balneatrix alpica]
MISTWTQRLLLFVKGMAMGAADIVPGVSGGTIAFISGIYDELILTLRNLHPRLLWSLPKQGWRATWQEANLTFLLTLLAGILTSVFTLAKGISWVLEHYPAILWSFFMGLVLASSWLVSRQVSHWQRDTYAGLLLGILIGWLATQGIAIHLEATPVTLFIGGAIAICAMILPGISGSFLLLLLGLYQPVIHAVKQLQLDTLMVFAAGCIVGLLAFSRLLHWLLHTHRAVTLAMLTGFMLGALGKVWPWKVTRVYRIDEHGQSLPLLQDNVLPGVYESMTGQVAMFGQVSLAFAVGMLVVVIIAWVANKRVH